MHRVLFIPGAWSTANCFNYYFDALAADDALTPVYVLYNIQTDSLPAVVGKVNETLDELTGNLDQKYVLVGHSLGGMIALACHDHPKVAGILTVASPIDGLDLNRLVQTLVSVRSPFLIDAMRRSSWVSDLHEIEYTKPICHIATKGGFHPAMYEENDGVVSYASQTRWKAPGAVVKTIKSTHHDILQHDQAAFYMKRMARGDMFTE